MISAVLLRIDSAGAHPVLVREDSEPLTDEEGVRWRLVAKTDDPAEAAGVIELLNRRRSNPPSVA